MILIEPFWASHSNGRRSIMGPLPEPQVRHIPSARGGVGRACIRPSGPWQSDKIEYMNRSIARERQRSASTAARQEGPPPPGLQRSLQLETSARARRDRPCWPYIIDANNLLVHNTYRPSDSGKLDDTPNVRRSACDEKQSRNQTSQYNS